MEQYQALPDSVYRLLVDEADAYAIIILDPQGIIQHWNPGAEHIFGWQTDEAIGQSGDIIFVGEDIAAGVPQREMKTAAAEGQAADRRWHREKSGSRFYADGTVIALHGAGGELVGFAKIMRDATAEKKTLASSEASEAQLGVIINSIRDYAIYMLDLDGTIRTWSRGAQRIKGYTPSEVIGRNFSMFYPPEDVEAGKPERQLRIAAERGTYEDESQHVRKDGSRFWSAVALSAIRNEQGHVTGFVNLTHDISERKRARERVQFLAEASRILGASIDYEQTLRQIAKVAVPRLADWCAVDLLGEDGHALTRVAVEHQDPSKVELAHELQRRYPAAPDDGPLAKVIQQRRTIFYPEVPEEVLGATAHDEEHLHMLRELGLRSAIVAPMISADRVLGTMTLVTSNERRLTTEDVNVAEDIAARAAAAVQNAQLYREAQEANRAKDDFLATVSHELRTPMTAIVGWAKLLKAERDPDTIEEAVTAIERSASAQSQLIEDILDVARIRVGKLRMRFGTVDLADVVATAADTVKLSAEEKHVDFRVEVHNGAIVVHGDEKRLQQVVWNLLTNAVKFTPEGGRIEVVLEKERSTARVTVRDNGAGISPDFLPHLFERFRQAETTQKRGYGGLGLGLSIAQYIVETHGGTITAESAGEGKGATFTVELPLAGGTVETERAGRRAEDAMGSLAGITVVTVEDDRDTLQFFSRAMERAGAVVQTATSVDEALEEIRKRRPDVIVSDIAMPQKTGYDLVQTVRSSDELAGIPIIAVTASGIAGDRERALTVGFDEYLRKPVDPRLLIRTICEVVGRKR